jgi:hypothetical protein
LESDWSRKPLLTVAATPTRCPSEQELSGADLMDQQRPRPLVAPGVPGFARGWDSRRPRLQRSLRSVPPARHVPIALAFTTSPQFR